MNKLRILMAAGVAMVTLACAASSASATNATLSPSGAFAASSNGPVRISAGIINLTCTVVLRGNISGSIRTSPGNSLGSINGSTASNCIGGTLTIDTTTPLNLSIAAVLGTLPNFTGVLVSISTLRFTVVVAGVTCIYAGTVGALAPNDNGPNANGSISVINILANTLARQAGSSALCPSTGSISTPQQFTLDGLRSVVIS